MRYCAGIMIINFYVDYVLAQYSDVRCKCICPKDTSRSNFTNIVIVNNLTLPDQCNCEHVVKREETFCLKCECKYETRNTLLIKVIVIFLITSIALLYLYMVFVFIQNKRKQPELSVTSDYIQESLKEPAVRKRRTLSISSFDRRMTEWQHKVHEQRNNVYGENSVLN